MEGVVACGGSPRGDGHLVYHDSAEAQAAAWHNNKGSE